MILDFCFIMYFVSEGHWVLGMYTLYTVVLTLFK